MTLKNQLWFAGSGSFGARCLSVLVESTTIVRVITAHPRPAGRHLAERETPVESAARKFDLPLTRTSDFNNDRALMDLYKGESPACILVVDFAQKIGEPFLSLPQPGCLNIHPSLLPAYRGSAPIQRAIMNGETRTGVTVFRLVPQMDAGPVLASTHIVIGCEDTFGDISELLAVQGTRLLLDGLELLCQGRISLKEQDHENASFAPRIFRSETELRWENPSKQVHDLVRAMNPVPGCFVFVGVRRLKIWKTRISDLSGEPGEIAGFLDGNPVVACGAGSVVLVEVQQEGKRRTDGAGWLRGINLKKGDKVA
ncbi:MAG: methionyl-tRNA formyltransferase [Thermovirgaceae bacterium]|nr:methionyl-tRNA formyltransferase [Thermovirgaceae bacterium]